MKDHAVDEQASSNEKDVLEQLVHHTELPTTKISRVLDSIIEHIGSLTSWLWVAVIAVIMTNVIGRYVFTRGSIALEELAWHLFAVAFLFGLSYTLVSDNHVRVDIFHERFSLKTQAFIEFLGLALLLLPFLYIVIAELIPYAERSFVRNERSQAPSGLPYRWILKSLIPVAFTLLAVAAFSRLLKCTALLFGFPKPLWKARS